ncbi:hypothetical protein G9A89_000350 [Geosiphon pyriformis]|nr:hypothetical protein G9A89_000350 [Geosiphon pyriformis]
MGNNGTKRLSLSTLEMVWIDCLYGWGGSPLEPILGGELARDSLYFVPTLILTPPPPPQESGGAPRPPPTARSAGGGPPPHHPGWLRPGGTNLPYSTMRAAIGI